jgi:outer membrane protein
MDSRGRRRAALLVLAAALIAEPATAQPAPPPGPSSAASEQRALSSVTEIVPTRTMTIGEALAYAHAHQPAIRAALSRISTRMAEAAIPSGQWLPKVTAAAEVFAMTANNTTATYVATDVLDVPRIGASAATATGSLSPYASTFVGAGVLQELFDFGRIGAQRAAADAQVVVEKQAADITRLDIDFGVEEGFFSVLAAKGVVQAADEAYARSLVHHELAKRGVDSGLRSPIELTRAEADLARYEVGRVRARGGLAVAQSVLAASIGAPDPAIDTADEAPTFSTMPTLHDALRLVEQREPHLAAALARLRASEERSRAVGAELRPDLSVTATISGRAGGAPPSAGPVAHGDGWLPDVPNWDAGLLLTWPLFDGVVVARRDAAAAEEQVRRDEIDAARLQVQAEATQAFEQFQVARSAVLVLQNGVVAARANWEQADARFRAGIGNAVELADAEALRTNAEIQLALGRFDVARARASFGRAIAEGLR